MAHLRLLCDEHIPLTIVEWLKKAPGRHKVATVCELGWGGLKDPVLIKKATNDNRVIVTRDREFRLAAKYPICTHSGILVLPGRRYTPEECIRALRNFLLSGERECCKHAIVTLHPESAWVEDVNGSRSLEFRNV